MATLKRLEVINVPIHPQIPILDASRLRPDVEVAQRLVSAYCLAGLANNADGPRMREWLKSEDAWDFVPESEKHYFSGSQLKASKINELSWMGETLYALAWAGRLTKSFPGECESPLLDDIFHLIPPEVSVGDFCDHFRLRDYIEVLTKLDLYYMLHCSLSHSDLWRPNQQFERFSLQSVVARRQSFEWLLAPGVEWHHITLDT